MAEEDDIPVTALKLQRQPSERTAALSLVGLGKYRNELVARGLSSLEDLKKFDDGQLREIGMDSPERYIFRLYADSEAVSPKHAHQSPQVSSASLGDCDICQEAPAEHFLECCDEGYCGNCLRSGAVTDGEFLVCPHFNDCKGVISADLSRNLFEHHCVHCGKDLNSTQAPVVDVACGFQHRAHMHCLQSFVEESIKAAVYPIKCPGHSACKCLISEATVRQMLLAPRNVENLPETQGANDPAETKQQPIEGGGGDKSQPNDSGGDKSQPYLAKFYRMAYDHAISINGFLVKCPGKSCGNMIDLRPDAGCRIPDCHDMQCNKCKRQFCSLCECPAHKGYNCDEFEEIKQEWMEFLVSQDSISSDIEAELERFRILQLDEQYKADHQKHCPHCGLIAQWTDGCNSMTCGRDASDKGGKIHSVLGCGKGFKWDKARPYKARFQKFDPRALKGSSKVQIDGVVMPARMCRVCFDTIRQGTCFEELSPTTSILSSDPTALFEYAMLKTFRQEHNIQPALFGNHDSGIVAALTMLVGKMRKRPMELPIDGKPFTGGHFGCAALRPPPAGRSTQTCETCSGKYVKCSGAYGYRDRHGSWHQAPPREDVLSDRPESPNNRWCTRLCEDIGKGRAKRSTSSAVSVFKSPPGPICTINLYASALGSTDEASERRRFARVRLHVNPPRYNENSPTTALVMLRFRTAQLELSLIERAVDAERTAGAHLDVQLPEIPLSTRRGWCTVLDRSSIVNAISTVFDGSLSPLEMDSAYTALSSVHIGLVCPGDGSKDASGCGVEQIEISSTAALARNVRQWFQQLGGNSTQEKSDINADAVKLCVCWKCIRLAFAKGTQDKSTSEGPTNKFSVGSLVSLSTSYTNPSNIDAADGPLRPGDVGVVAKVDDAPVPQPVFVRTFNGKGAWYSRRALVCLPDGDTPTIAVSAAAKALSQPLEILARNDEIDLSVCKLVHPLTPDQLARRLYTINRDVVHIPLAVLPSSVASAIPPSPGSTVEVESSPASATDLLQVANRLDAVNRLAHTFTDPLIANFAVTGLKYLHNMIGSLPQITEASFPGLNAPTLARLRKVTCDSVVTAERWVHGPQKLDDTSFMEAASLVLILAVKTYDMVREACINVAYQRGVRLPLRPQYMATGPSAKSTESAETDTVVSRWACAACTFVNDGDATACQICGGETRTELPKSKEEPKVDTGGSAKAESVAELKSGTRAAVAIELDESIKSQTVANALKGTPMTQKAQDAVVTYVGKPTTVEGLRMIPLEEVEMMLHDTLTPTDHEVLRQVIGPVLPPLLQQQIANKGVDGLAALEKLWLELELQSAPVVPAWMRDPARLIMTSEVPPPPIQNLQYGDFVGDLEAFILRCDPSRIQHLANLWVLVLSPRSGGLSAQVVSTHAVGDRVLLIDDQTALVMLERPVPVQDNHAIAFTCVAPTGDSQAVLQSPSIFCSRPNGKRIESFPEPLGCGPTCSNSHSGHGNCLVCGSGWGSHSGHTCRAGTRGSWARNSSEPLPDVQPDSHVQMSAGAMPSPPASSLSTGLRVGIATGEDKPVLQVRLFSAPSSSAGTSGHGAVVSNGRLVSATEAFGTRRMIMNICARWAKNLLRTDKANRETKKNAEFDKQRKHPPRKEHLAIVKNIEKLVRDQWAKHRHGLNVAKLGDLYKREFGSPGYKKLGKLAQHCEGVRIEYPKTSIKMLYPAETAKPKAPKMTSELRLSDSHVLWLLRTGMFRLCMVQTSEGDAVNERDALSVGAHVLVRQNETVGFTEHAVVVANKVPGAQTGNTNKMVVYSGESAESVGAFLPLQCAEADMSPMGPTQPDWQLVAIAAIKALRDSRASEGGASKSGSALSSRLLEREALLRQVAPFVIHHRQDISIADFEWFVKELEASANPSPHMLENLRLHIEVQKKAGKAMRNLSKCVKLADVDGGAKVNRPALANLRKTLALAKTNFGPGLPTADRNRLKTATRLEQKLTMLTAVEDLKLLHNEVTKTMRQLTTVGEGADVLILPPRGDGSILSAAANCWKRGRVVAHEPSAQLSDEVVSVSVAGAPSVSINLSRVAAIGWGKVADRIDALQAAATKVEMLDPLNGPFSGAVSHLISGVKTKRKTKRCPCSGRHNGGSCHGAAGCAIGCKIPGHHPAGALMDTKGNVVDGPEAAAPLAEWLRTVRRLSAVRPCLALEADLLKAIEAGIDALQAPSSEARTTSLGELVTSLRQTLRAAGTEMARHTKALGDKRQAASIGALHKAAGRLRSQLHAASCFGVLEMALSQAPKSPPEVSDESDMSVDLLESTLREAQKALSVFRGSASDVEIRASAGGGEKSALGDIWDVGLSSLDGLEINGASVTKKQGEHVPEYATAFMTPEVHRATFALRNVQTSCVYIGVVANDVDNTIGWASSRVDGRCWYKMQSGHLRCGSDTIVPNPSGASSRLAQGDSLVVAIEEEAGETFVAFLLTKAGASEASVTQRLPLDSSVLGDLTKLRLGVCLERRENQVEVTEVALHEVKAPTLAPEAVLGDGAAKPSTPEEALLLKAAQTLASLKKAP